MPPVDGEQLAAEAVALKDELTGEGAAAGAGQGDKVPEGESPAQGATGGAPGDGSQPDDFHQEHIPNPAPKIAATLKALRGNVLVIRLVPPKVRAVFDDMTCEQLGDALGPLALKYAPTVTPQLDAFMERWGVEINAAYVLGSVAWNVYGALEADQDAARAAAARDVTPPQQQRGDPPNPAAGVPPVEPGVGPVS